MRHALKAAMPQKETQNKDVGQKDVETSLISRFLYPKYGVGQMWDVVAEGVIKKGGIIVKSKEVIGIEVKDQLVVAVDVKNLSDGTIERVPCDYFISTMPIKDLIKAMGSSVPEPVRQIAHELAYRDFISIGVLLKDIQLSDEKMKSIEKRIKDNWIYVQENSVKMGRIQIFNNWSQYMVKNKEDVWIGLEYFCNEGDGFWEKSDAELIDFGIDELIEMGAIKSTDILDATCVRMPKAYPSYIGSYNQFDKVKSFLNTIENLYPIGRNGMHRYNNMDHSMLSAMQAVKVIKGSGVSKETIWTVNAEQTYHEEKEKNTVG